MANKIFKKYSKPKSLVILCGTVIFMTIICNCSKPFDKVSMVGKIKKIAKLSTVKFKLKKIIYAKEKKKLLFFRLKNASYLSVIRPEVEAGIDLAKISESDIVINNDKRKVTINLPPIEITKYDYPMEEAQIDINFTHSTFLNKINLEDIEQYHRKADMTIREYINFLGIKERAEKSTITFINKLFANSNYIIEVKFKKSGKPLMYYDLTVVQ